MPIGVYKRPTLEERLKKGITVNPENNCWEWNKCRDHNGYGKIGVGSNCVRPTHVIAYELYIGEIPKGEYICHKCDNKPCCNPFHLFSGTQKENLLDAQRKGITPTKQHPSLSCYSQGCRCEDCCALQSEYMKKWYRENIDRRKEYDKARRATPEYKQKEKEWKRIQYAAKKLQRIEGG